MEEVRFAADRRQIVGKQVKAIRRSGTLPAVIYGKNIGSIPISLDYKEASRVLDRISPSTLVVIDIADEEHFALVREKQRDPILGTIRHVDFQAVSLTEKVRASVNVQLVGESPAVENYFAILVTNLEQIEVECLPRDLPDRIDVDVSVIKQIGDHISVGDLQLPPGVEVVHEPDETVVIATAPVAEEAVAEEELVEEAEVEPEVIERGKREEEEE